MNPSPLESLLAAALPGLALPPIGSAPGRYRFRLAAGSSEPREASAHIDGNWLVLQAPTAQQVPAHPLERAVAQSVWEGGINWACADERDVGFLHVDVPLLVETPANRDWFARQLQWVAAGLEAACSPPGASMRAAARRPELWDPEIFAEDCRAEGWPATVKSEGELWVTVASRAMQRTVAIARADGAVRAAVALASPKPLPRDPRVLTAAGIFLARATSSLRWARAWARTEEGAIADLGFECFVVASDDTTPLRLAIDALATACECFACEAEALLASPTLAHAYLDHACATRGDIAGSVLPQAGTVAPGVSPGVFREAAAF